MYSKFSRFSKAMVLLLLVVFISQMVAINVFASNKTATLRNSKVYINDIEYTLQSYVVDNNTYFRLRDLASIMNNEDMHFDVTYDANTKMINLDRTKYYNGSGDANYSSQVKTEPAVLSTSKLSVNGRPVSNVTAYVFGGYNFYKLRDLAQYLNINVEWKQETDSIHLTSKDLPTSGVLNNKVASKDFSITIDNVTSDNNFYYLDITFKTLNTQTVPPNSNVCFEKIYLVDENNNIIEARYSFYGEYQQIELNNNTNNNITEIKTKYYLHKKDNLDISKTKLIFENPVIIRSNFLELNYNLSDYIRKNPSLAGQKYTPEASVGSDLYEEPIIPSRNLDLRLLPNSPTSIGNIFIDNGLLYFRIDSDRYMNYTAFPFFNLNTNSRTHAVESIERKAYVAYVYNAGTQDIIIESTHYNEIILMNDERITVSIPASSANDTAEKKVSYKECDIFIGKKSISIENFNELFVKNFAVDYVAHAQVQDKKGNMPFYNGEFFYKNDGKREVRSYVLLDHSTREIINPEDNIGSILFTVISQGMEEFYLMYGFDSGNLQVVKVKDYEDAANVTKNLYTK